MGGGRRAYGENVEGAVPIQGEIGLEHHGVGDLAGALTDGGSEAVDPGPAACGERE